MSSLKNELPLWRDVSRKLDELRTPERKGGPARACPFCGRTTLHVETMETVSDSDAGLRIDFVSCDACNENWSVVR